MSSAVIQRGDRLDEAASTATVATFAAGVGLAPLALGLSPLVGLYFHSREVGVVAAALSGVLFVNASSVVPDALLRRRFSFLRRGVVDPLKALVYGAVGDALLAEGLGVWALVVATYASRRFAWSASGSSLAGCPTVAPFRLRCGASSPATRAITPASQFLRQASGILNTALLGRFLGLAPLGEYRFG